MSIFYFENTPHGVRKDGSKLNTKTHNEYISRTGKYAHMENRTEDLVYLASGNIPEWADNAEDFWEQAELHRAKNGRAYREFRIGLQEEFSLQENQELIERFIKETGIEKLHAYTYAIHDKAAAFDKNHRNIHCHLMFNEKSIEENRPLSPEKYFKNYAENRIGEPTQGYRTNAYWDKKSTTYELRKKWADIVNEKFSEKNMDCTISEKSNQARRQELIAAGKYEEAELLNRTPAPHLGSAYRNPVTMEKIMQQVEVTDWAADHPESDDDPDFSTLSKQEQTIALFANDIVIRKVARQIQQERLRMQKAIDDENAAIEAEEILKEPYTITVEDLYDYVDEKFQSYQQDADNNLAAYRMMKKSILSDKELQRQATEKAFNNQYGKTQKEYALTAQKLDAAKQKAATLYGHKEDVHELAACSSEIQRLTDERNRLGKQLNYYRTAIAGSAKEKINNIHDVLSAENASCITESKKLYAAYLSAKKQAEKYVEIRNQLADEDMSVVVFSEKLPNQLNRRCKIEGEQSISKLPTLAFEGDSYAILDKLPDTDTCTVFAVRIGDDIKRGKTTKYQLMIQRKKSAKRNTWTVVTAKPKTDKATGHIETVRLYRQSHKTQQQHISRKSSNPAIENAHRTKRNIVSSKVSAIAEKLIADKEKTGKLNIHWNEEKLKDKAVQNEEKMYQGWSL